MHDSIPAARRIAVGADHGGFELKQKLLAHLADKGYDAVDGGPFALDPQDDYPDFAHPVAAGVSIGTLDAGILLCRTGIGMSIAANRYPGVRAALCNAAPLAVRSREHNCSNVLVTGGDGVADQDVLDIVDQWLATPFSQEERHARRLAKLEDALPYRLQALCPEAATLAPFQWQEPYVSLATTTAGDHELRAAAATVLDAVWQRATGKTARTTTFVHLDAAIQHLLAGSDPQQIHLISSAPIPPALAKFTSNPTRPELDTDALVAGDTFVVLYPDHPNPTLPADLPPATTVLIIARSQKDLLGSAAPSCAVGLTTVAGCAFAVSASDLPIPHNADDALKAAAHIAAISAKTAAERKTRNDHQSKTSTMQRTTQAQKPPSTHA